MIRIDLSSKRLTTLKGQNIPEIIDFFNCSFNPLTSLKFGPKEVGKFFCSNSDLTSLEFCPTKIGDEIYCCVNSISDLKNIHNHFKNGYIKNVLNLELNPLKSHVLGVILIPELQRFFINDVQLQQILNKHLLSGRDVLECQEELIRNGFKDFAKL